VNRKKKSETRRERKVFTWRNYHEIDGENPGRERERERRYEAAERYRLQWRENLNPLRIFFSSIQRPSFPSPSSSSSSPSSSPSSSSSAARRALCPHITDFPARASGGTRSFVPSPPADKSLCDDRLRAGTRPLSGYRVSRLPSGCRRPAQHEGSREEVG